MNSTRSKNEIATTIASSLPSNKATQQNCPPSERNVYAVYVWIPHILTPVGRTTEVRAYCLLCYSFCADYVQKVHTLVFLYRLRWVPCTWQRGNYTRLFALCWLSCFCGICKRSGVCCRCSHEFKAVSSILAFEVRDLLCLSKDIRFNAVEGPLILDFKLSPCLFIYCFSAYTLTFQYSLFIQCLFIHSFFIYIP
jgi:hypothetical protein